MLANDLFDGLILSIATKAHTIGEYNLPKKASASHQVWQSATVWWYYLVRFKSQAFLNSSNSNRGRTTKVGDSSTTEVLVMEIEVTELEVVEPSFFLRRLTLAHAPERCVPWTDQHGNYPGEPRDHSTNLTSGWSPKSRFIRIGTSYK